MDKIIIIGIILCIILQVIMIIVLILNKHNKEQSYEIKTIQSSINELNQKQERQSQVYNKQNLHIEDTMYYIQNDLRTIMSESSQSKIQLHHIYDKVQSVNNIMINKKLRGNYGEYQLNHILSVYAGETKEVYEMQYKLSNNMIADAALRLPDESRVLIIDSKFPLENYQSLTRDDLNEIELLKYQSLFKQNIKKHIDDISKKYITHETLESAVMFIPSEAIYFYICSELSDIIEYAYKKHILITSPTTLLGVVFTLVNITKDMKRTKNMKQLEKNIIAMYDDTIRLKQRLTKLENTISTLTNHAKDVTISAEKICNKIERIHDGYIEE